MIVRHRVGLLSIRIFCFLKANTKLRSYDLRPQTRGAKMRAAYENHDPNLHITLPNFKFFFNKTSFIR